VLDQTLVRLFVIRRSALYGNPNKKPARHGRDFARFAATASMNAWSPRACPNRSSPPPRWSPSTLERRVRSAQRAGYGCCEAHRAGIGHVTRRPCTTSRRCRSAARRRPAAVASEEKLPSTNSPSCSRCRLGPRQIAVLRVTGAALKSHPRVVHLSALADCLVYLLAGQRHRFKSPLSHDLLTFG